MSQPFEPRKDPAVKHAAATLKNHFTDRSGKPIRTPYYKTHLQVLYENDYFPWVVSDAIRILVEDGFLTEVRKPDIIRLPKQLPYIRDIVFVANAQAYADNPTLVKTHALNTARLVNHYSNPKISKALGDHLEGLVRAELRALGFTIAAVHTNQYREQRWTDTEHDLDIIAEHKSSRLNLGVEVKNTLDLTEPSEIDTKIDICNFHGLTPVFAVRWMKPYIDCIRNQGGFSIVFKTQIYPPGFEEWTKKLFAKLSVLTRADLSGDPLQFPVTVRTDLPPRSVRAFQRWIEQSIATPPQRNPLARCGGQRSSAQVEI